MEVPDSFPANFDAKQQVGAFTAYADAYLSLLDGLLERKVPVDIATQTSIELITSYFQYTNNNKFAEATSGAVLGFVPEEE